MVIDNIFQGLQETAYNIVTKIIGCEASWNPSDSSPEQTARVLFREPTVKERVDLQIQNEGQVFFMEYKSADFTGLFTSIQAGNSESVTIQNVLYFVENIEAIAQDGNTYKARLMVHN